MINLTTITRIMPHRARAWPAEILPPRLGGSPRSIDRHLAQHDLKTSRAALVTSKEDPTE